MVRFNTVKNAEGKIVRFSVTGHTGYAESGSDIVCSAVSSAVWMTINGIEKQKLAELDVEQSDGFVECSISEERSNSADALLESLVMFMSEISKQYEKYICITQK